MRSIVGEAAAIALRPPAASRKLAAMSTAGARPATEHVDVLIVGAGLSGIGAACRLQTRCPERSFAIVEARDRSGGTWDLFRYPGVRSDSDMFTLGYPFRPWTGAKAIADGPAILDVPARDRARARHRPADPLRPPRRRAPTGRATTRAWTVDIERGAARRAAAPDAAASSSCAAATSATPRATRRRSPAPSASPAASSIRSSGPTTSTIAGKRVVVIGSGATAVTLVPALAQSAAARDDAAALADLDGVAAVRGRPGEVAAPAGCRCGAANAVMRWQTPAPRHVLLQPLPAPSRSARSGCCSAAFAPGWARSTTLDAALHAALRPVATSACAWCPTATCSAPSGAAAPPIATDEIESFTADRRAPASAARSCRPT